MEISCVPLGLEETQLAYRMVFKHFSLNLLEFQQCSYLVK